MKQIHDNFILLYYIVILLMSHGKKMYLNWH